MVALYNIVLSLLIIFLSLPVYSAEHGFFDVMITPPQVYQGDVAVLKIQAPRTVQSAEYIQDNRSILFYYDNDTHTHRAFLGIDVDERPGTHDVLVQILDKNGLSIAGKFAFTVLKKEFTVQHLSVPESQVTLSLENQERNEREQKTVSAVLQSPLRDQLISRRFIKPLQAEPDTPFGVRRFFNKKPKNPHSGVDFKSPEGTPVMAAGEGIVVLTGNHFFSGNSVFIDHGGGIITMYFHLAAVTVSSGDRINRGQVIGRVGATGRATGPHLHWGMRINNQRVDPLSLLECCND